MKKKARGFTLIEILVALTMFAVVGGALLQLFEQGLRATRQAADYSHAVLLARSKLTELLAYDDLTPGTMEGDFADGFRWQAVLSAPPDEEAEPSSWLKPLFLRLKITWGDSVDENAFDLETICLTQATDP